ncbi:caspase family protein [Arenibaculum pallidiluteum]|uniref:caspase family protein n=1 Tax=Arenibaculum pallidiluteum TaxID=2812559 RepID=UPI001A960C92|nr:caspase family protein [Arenibaculum pallidiluteum]
MPPPFDQLRLDEFAEMLARFSFRRRVNAVHVHHTWRPGHADYDGAGTIEGMWRFHTATNGWSDIAQHVTIAPDGKIWLGRNWNLPPASAAGHNGNAEHGPFMFEMIGNFDRGGDPWEDPQRAAAVEVTALVQRRFGLSAESLRFHNEMSGKSCPGDTIDRTAFLQDVQRAHQRLAETARDGVARAAPFTPDAYRLNDVVDRFSREVPAFRDPPDAEPMERHEDSRGGAGDGAAELTPDDLAELRLHVVNLVQGRFSTDGRFTTTEGDVLAIFAAMRAQAQEAKARGEALPVVFYAHGGLNSEVTALATARDQLRWWRANGVYPVFFVWETGLLETIGQLLGRSRQIVRQRGVRGISDVSDALIEATARALFGPRIWSGMKRSAERAVDKPAGNRAAGGGARFVAAELARLCADASVSIELHAVGHSAGAIFHSHFVPACREEGTHPFRTLSLLAPAIRVDGFGERLAGLVGTHVQRLGVFTMRKDLELADNVGQVYRKSLLYLIHHALEAEARAPILGLELSLRADPALRQLFGLDGSAAPHADVVWSKTPASAGPAASRSTTHGGFDNDPATMNAVLRRMLGRATGDIVEFPPPARGGFAGDGARLFDWPDGLDLGPILDWSAAADGGAGAPSAAVPTPAAGAWAPKAGAEDGGLVAAEAGNGRRRALCVGIDRYGSRPLSGCVADAKLWSRTLQGLGFTQPVRLIDEQATHDAILGALQELVRSSRAGDVVVFQFAGHGIQLPDASGDEKAGDSPDMDEALCPFDMDEGAFLLDDEIGRIFDEIPPGVNVTCFIDCCHSGTISRFGVGPGPAGVGAARRARFLVATPELIAAHRTYRRMYETEADRRQRQARKRARSRETMPEVLFSACRSTEVALETAGQGDFTLRATRELAAGMPGMTNAEFLERVTAAFGAVPAQHPGLYCADGAEDAPLFGAVAGRAVPGARPAGRAVGAARSPEDRLRRALHLVEAITDGRL